MDHRRILGVGKTQGDVVKVYPLLHFAEQLMLLDARQRYLSQSRSQSKGAIAALPGREKDFCVQLTRADYLYLVANDEAVPYKVASFGRQSESVASFFIARFSGRGVAVIIIRE
jgi:hypothetical protein